MAKVYLSKVTCSRQKVYLAAARTRPAATWTPVLSIEAPRPGLTSSRKAKAMDGSGCMHSGLHLVLAFGMLYVGEKRSWPKLCVVQV